MKLFYCGVRCTVLLVGLNNVVAHAQSGGDFSAQQLQRQQQREQMQNQRFDELRGDARLARPPGPAGAMALAAPYAYPAEEQDCFVIARIELTGAEADRFSWALKAADDAIGRCLGADGIGVVMDRVQRALAEAGYVTTARLAAPRQLLNGLLQLKVVSADSALASSAPVRLSLWADDGGSKATGKYQAGVTVYLDNLLARHELLNITANRELADGGARADRGTRYYALNYAIPAGVWLLSLNASHYRYFQTISGGFQEEVYSGTSSLIDAKAALVIQRDALRKTTAALRLFQRRGNSFIDANEMEMQRRRMGGYELSLAHREFIGASTLYGSLSYKRGNRLFGSLAAPEEEFGGGSARPTIFNADVTLQVPWSLAGVKLEYQGNWRRQWSAAPVLFQDRFVIGGRYTVRGFDGESSLSAQRGWLLRNELGWQVNDRHQLYGAMDYGRLGGDELSQQGRALAGSVLGWRAQMGRTYLDVFAGRALHKPVNFPTATISAGFSVNYQY